MSVVYVLIPVAGVVLAAAIGGFVWASRRGQFDDLETPPMRVLGDDDRPGR